MGGNNSNIQLIYNIIVHTKQNRIYNIIVHTKQNRSHHIHIIGNIGVSYITSMVINHNA